VAVPVVSVYVSNRVAAGLARK